MHAREEVLAKQLGERNNFQIPLWQRRYAWTKPQWNSLWNDVWQQYTADKSSAKHFVGSLILHARTKQHVGDPAPVTVVDGQQRLLTILILLAAARDHNSAAPGGGTSDDFELFLFNNKATGNLRYRLVPQETDRPAFFGVMDGVPQTSSAADPKASDAAAQLLEPAASDDPDTEEEPEELPQHAIRDAYEFFRSQFKSLSAPLDPSKFITTVMERLEVVAITLEDHDSYHRIFQTVNAEGVELRDVDLVRNYLFMLLGDTADETYRAHWRPTEEALGGAFGQFLVADLVSRGQQASAQRRSIFGGYRSILRPIESSQADIRIEVQRLHARSKDFTRVLARDAQLDAAQRDADSRLRFLSEWGSVPLQALLLRLTSAKGMPPEDLVRALRAIESLVVRRFLRRTPPNDLRSRFNAIALKNVKTADALLAQAIVDAFEDEAARWPTDDEVRVAVAQVATYDGPRARQTFLVLKRLSSRVQGKEFPSGVQFGREVGKYSVEHILPQKPEKWLTDLASWNVEDVPAFISAWTHTLPNLALTAFNPDMGNSRFSEKRPWLEKSSIELTREIAAESVWAEHALEARTKRMADLVIAEWPRG